MKWATKLPASHRAASKLGETIDKPFWPIMHVMLLRHYTSLAHGASEEKRCAMSVYGRIALVMRILGSKAFIHHIVQQ